MLKTLNIFILVFVQLIAYSQNKNKIDSLLSLVKQSKNDSIKAELYISISDEYWSDNAAQCKEYANMALNISKKINSHNLMSSAYRNLGTASSFLGNSFDALYYDRLSLAEAIYSGNDRKLMALYANLADDLTGVSKFDSANLFLDKGIQIAKKYNDTARIVVFYINKGNNLYYQSKFDSCELFFQHALNQAIAIKDSDNLLKC